MCRKCVSKNHNVRSIKMRPDILENEQAFFGRDAIKIYEGEFRRFERRPFVWNGYAVLNKNLYGGMYKYTKEEKEIFMCV